MDTSVSQLLARLQFSGSAVIRKRLLLQLDREAPQVLQSTLAGHWQVPPLPLPAASSSLTACAATTPPRARG